MRNWRRDWFDPDWVVEQAVADELARQRLEHERWRVRPSRCTAAAAALAAVTASCLKAYGRPPERTG